MRAWPIISARTRSLEYCAAATSVIGGKTTTHSSREYTVLTRRANGREGQTETLAAVDAYRCAADTTHLETMHD